MMSYNKIILFVMTLPLFTASIAVGGLQTAYGGFECQDNADCEGGDFCNIEVCEAGQCVLEPAFEGDVCNPGGICFIQVCEAGQCVVDTAQLDGSECGDGDECNIEVCQAGQCVLEPEPEFDGDVCNPGGLCFIQVCDTGQCVVDTAQLDGSECGDGDECNIEVCQEGQCVQDPEPEGTACGDPSNNLCDNPDTCDGSGTCDDNLEPNGTVCRASSGVCDIEEFCDGSSASCPIDVFQPTGTVCSCSVGEGVCDENNECFVEISIDIKPGSDPNSINTKSMGVVPVAILGSDTLDVTTVDYENIEFGPDGAMPVHVALEDVNDDGFTDLVMHFVQKETGIGKGDVEACISGDTLGGQPFLGCDAIKTPGK